MFSLRAVLLICLIIAGGGLAAQDTGFSQYYQSPLSLNPAFAGSADGGRVGLNYRFLSGRQDSIRRIFAAYSDFRLGKLSTGFVFMSEKAERRNFVGRSFAVPVNYRLYIREKIALIPAVQVSYSVRKPVFERTDSLDQRAYKARVSYWDLALGAVLSIRNLWLGLGVFNLTNRDISLEEQSVVHQKARYSFHGGYSIILREAGRDQPTISVMPTFRYDVQDSMKRVDAGLVGWLEPWLIGAAYRSVAGYPRREAVSFMAGIRKYDLNIGYSYDLPLSDGRFSGFHEISINFSFSTASDKPPRSVRKLKNPVWLKREPRRPDFLKQYINFMDSRF